MFPVVVEWHIFLDLVSYNWLRGSDRNTKAHSFLLSETPINLSVLRSIIVIRTRSCYCIHKDPPLKPISSWHPYIPHVPRVNTADLQAGDAQFEIQPRIRLAKLKAFAVFFSPSMQIPQQYIKRGHAHPFYTVTKHYLLWISHYSKFCHRLQTKRKEAKVRKIEYSWQKWHTSKISRFSFLSVLYTENTKIHLSSHTNKCTSIVYFLKMVLIINVKTLYSFLAPTCFDTLHAIIREHSFILAKITG
jgi:hypothetical protein